ncbi:FecCD family ABC transporter permease [Oscillospiraceae bacterium LTW-04]|nr:iron ABC transporter permease [Oscillospiraceae bacterium MB24-C1]
MEKAGIPVCAKKSDIQKRKFYISGGAVITLLAILLIACIIASFLIGRYPVPIRELFGIIFSKAFSIEPYWITAQETAVWNIRMPRVILSMLVGACLSAAGASYQGIFQNPMAAPHILGASAGAGFGAALAIYIGLSSMNITILAFAMSLLTVALVFWISKHTKGDRVLGIILAGIIISSLFKAGISFIKLVADPTNKLPAITYWLMGSLSGVTQEEVGFVFWPMLLGLLPLFLLRWRLNVLSMGDDEARAMGVNTGYIRLSVMICATLITAASISVSGMIEWVGLIIPHMMRRLVGSDYRLLMPASILGGGIFLLIVDNISRSLMSSEIPIGILTAIVGAPLFLFLVTGRGERT